MHQRNTRIRLLLMLSIMLFIATAGASVSQAKTISPLKVKGTHLVNSKGNVVQLKGVSTHGIAWYPQYVNTKSFKSFKKMGANTIRLAVYSSTEEGYSTDLFTKIEEGINIASNLNMYVILDWHILNHGNPKTDQAKAKQFFRYFAKKYKNAPNLLYEICNEPNGSDVTWEKSIKPYANTIIPMIKKYNKDAVIIVGTPTWSQDVDIAANSPIKGYSNLMYTLHFYAATHTDAIRKKCITAIKKGLPVFVTEFSISDASGNGKISKKQGKKWMKLLKKYKISRVAWSLCNKNETSALIKPGCTKSGGFKKSDLSKTGKWIVKNW